jgi:hypothetical protein
VTGTAALEAWVEAYAEAVPLPAFAQPAAAPAPEPAAADDQAGTVAEGQLPDAGAGMPVEQVTRVLGMRPRWAAVVAGILLLQASVIGWYWSRPAPGPVEGEGELVVTSRPAEAQVIVDGAVRGVTPLTVTLAAGTHVVEVRAGKGEPRVIPLIIRANVQTAQYVELQEAVPVPPAVETRAASKRR